MSSMTITAGPGISVAGQGIYLKIVVVDDTGVPVTPATLVLTFRAPDGSSSTASLGGTIVTDSVGNFHCTYLPAVTGLFHGTGVSTVPNTADDFAFEADAVGDSTAWAPTSDDVAALLAHLTVDASGVPTGKFSTTSSPTATQVALLVQDISGEIAAAAGVIPPLLYEDAKLVAILGTAALVETSFSDQSDVLANLLAQRYQNALARLITGVAQVNQSGQVEPEGTPPQAQFAFPDITTLDFTTVSTVW
jgi:hypothetical protein